MYFPLLPRLQKFSINTPVQAVPGLLLLLAFNCITRGLMTCVAVMSFVDVPFAILRSPTGAE